MMKSVKEMSKPCRLLYLVGQLGPGGTERQLVCLLETLDRKRYLPAVVVWNFQENDTYVKQIRELGIEVLALSRGLGPIGKFVEFGQMVRELKPEVIHSYCFYTNFVAFYGKLLTGAVAVGAIQSDFEVAKKNSGVLLGRLSARWPKTHISNNLMAAEGAKNSKSLFSPRKVFVVRNGLDLKKFKKMNLANVERTKILAIGSLLPVKRWDRLLDAAAKLKHDGHDFLIRFVGVGPLDSALKKQTETLGLSNFVQFLGYRNDIPDLLADSHFLTHTSASEGCPNVVTEAMACGRAVVATDVGDVPFLVDEGETGFVVAKEDLGLLTQRMSMLIKDIELCHRMGEKGRLKAEKEFSLDRLLSETLAVYRNVGWNER